MVYFVGVWSNLQIFKPDKYFCLLIKGCVVFGTFSRTEKPYELRPGNNPARFASGSAEWYKGRADDVSAAHGVAGLHYSLLMQAISF